MLLGLKATNSFLILRVFEKNAPPRLLCPAHLSLGSVSVSLGSGPRICLFSMSAVDNGWCWVSPGQPVGNVGLWLCYFCGEFGMENARDFVAMYVLNRHITIEVC